jgi:predicted RNA methylase
VTALLVAGLGVVIAVTVVWRGIDAGAGKGILVTACLPNGAVVTLATASSRRVLAAARANAAEVRA